MKKNKTIFCEPWNLKMHDIDNESLNCHNIHLLCNWTLLSQCETKTKTCLLKLLAWKVNNWNSCIELIETYFQYGKEILSCNTWFHYPFIWLWCFMSLHMHVGYRHTWTQMTTSQPIHNISEVQQNTRNVMT